MTPEKVLEVVERYRKFFEKKNVKKVKLSEKEFNQYFFFVYSIDRRMVIEHCNWMLDEVEKFAKDGRTEKAYGWICFIQGVLLSSGYFSLDEFRNHNRPNDETTPT